MACRQASMRFPAIGGVALAASMMVNAAQADGRGDLLRAETRLGSADTDVPAMSGSLLPARLVQGAGQWWVKAGDVLAQFTGDGLQVNGHKRLQLRLEMTMPHRQGMSRQQVRGASSGLEAYVHSFLLISVQRHW